MKARRFLSILLLCFTALTLALVGCDAPVSGGGNGGNGGVGGSGGTGGNGDGGDHTHVYTSAVTEPTCLVDGYTTYTCTCGHSYTADPTPAPGHTAGDFTLVTPAGANTPGREEQRCTVCGELLDERDIPPTGSVGLKYEWVASSNTYRVVGIGDCTDTDIVIPAKHEGRPVKQIWKYAFKDNKNITSVYIPSSVISVMEGAFYHCTALERVTLSEGLLGIGASAFSGCRSLTELHMPSTVNSLGTSAFMDCESLTAVTVSGAISRISESAFYDCKKLERVALSASLGAIDARAFYGCSSLVEVTMGELVGRIGEYAFAGCTFLRELDLSDGLERIEQFAFYDCEALTRVTFGESLTYIGKSAFGGCSALGPITLPRTLETIDERAFADCMAMSKVTLLGKQLSQISRGAFNSCGVSEIVYPGNKTEWESITKGSSWMPIGILTVHCSNGDIRIAY